VPAESSCGGKDSYRGVSRTARNDHDWWIPSLAM
jgi:hypothetical protein